MKQAQQNSRHSQTEHLRVELIKRLEQSDFIFAQSPKIITNTLKSEPDDAHEKIFIRAERIDSNGALLATVENALLYIRASRRILWLIYGLFGFVGVAGLLGSNILNFFYLLMALLGWHTLTLVWWLIGLFSKKSALMESIIDKITLQAPLMARFFHDNKDSHQTILSILGEHIKPVKKWYLASIIHSNWIFALLGSLLGLFSLFLFKKYTFTWESTLLSDAHFAQMMQIFGFLPAVFGFQLPDVQQPELHRASFAWLMMISITLYGLLPRTLAYLYSKYKSNLNFQINFSDYYYQNLLSELSQKIIDSDDYQPNDIKANAPIKLTDKLLKATLERPLSDSIHLKIWQDYGVVDSGEDIEQLLHLADAEDAQIILVIYNLNAPDRGTLRKIDTIAQAKRGMIAHLHASDSVHNQAWQQALQQRNIQIL